MSSSFVVIGLDPPNGLCVLDERGALLRALELPVIDAEMIVALDDVLEVADGKTLVLGVELPADVLPGGRGDIDKKTRISIERALNKARGRADAVRVLILDRRPDVVVFEARAAEIRRLVFGAIPMEKLPPGKKRDRAAEIDRHIGRMLPRMVKGWPKRSNGHQRDAGAAALWVLGKYRVERLGRKAQRAGGGR